MRRSFFLYAAASFRAADMTVERASNPPPLPPMKGVKFGRLFTPHMLEIDYKDGAWCAPTITPFHNFDMPPQTSCLHYALQCFEGMKVYADIQDIETVGKGEKLAAQHLRLFRPEMNIARLQHSTARLCFPAFDGAEFQTCVEAFAKVEKDYVPKQFGYSLYLRPSAIGMDPNLGASASHAMKLYVIASPVGPYYPPPPGQEATGALGIKPVKLWVEEKHKRAWPGGTGGTKLGANYAGPMLAQEEAHARGYDQVLWLGAANQVQEVGAMNFCVLWKRADGKAELITAPLDGTILPGVTRDSILGLARQWGEFEVSEKDYTMDELEAALKEGRVIECFGCGTAAIVSPVCAVHYRGQNYDVPCPEQSITKRILKEILDIQYGVTPKPEWSRLLEC